MLLLPRASQLSPASPVTGVEQRRARQLPYTDRRAADHQDDPATIAGRITDLAKPRFQALTRQMLHDPILAGPLPSWPTQIPPTAGNHALAATAAPSPTSKQPRTPPAPAPPATAPYHGNRIRPDVTCIANSGK